MLENIPVDVIDVILQNVDNKKELSMCSKTLSQKMIDTGRINSLKFNWSDDASSIITQQCKYDKYLKEIHFDSVSNPFMLVILNVDKLILENCRITETINTKVYVKELVLKYWFYESVVIDLDLFPELERVTHTIFVNVKLCNAGDRIVEVVKMF